MKITAFLMRVSDGKIEESISIDPSDLGISVCSRCGDLSNCKELEGKQVCYDCATPAEVAEVNARVQCDCPNCSARPVN